MKKNTFVTTFIFIIFISLTAVFLLKNNFEKFFDQKNTPHDKKQISIAILTPVTHQSLEKIEQAFRSTLEKENQQYQYNFTTFNANGNRALLHAQAEEISNSAYDLIFTIATQPTLLMKELSTKKQLATPIVFAAADQRIENKIVQSYEQPGGNVTGVYEHSNFDLQVNLLLLIKPTVKRVLIVYNPAQASGLEQYKRQYESLFAARNIAVHSLEVFQAHDVYQKLSAKLSSTYDLVLVMKDNTVVPAVDSIIKLCSMHRIPLYASDLDSGYKGAAISFGVFEESFGNQAALLAKKIIEEKQAPATLSCVTPGKEYFLINMNTAREQGLDFTEEQQLLYLHIMTIGE